MTQHLLIATDFSIDSVNVLKSILKEKETSQENVNFHIHFVCGYYMGDSIRDLLFSNKQNVLKNLKSQNFCEACSILRNKYPELIKNISFDLYAGYFQRTFNQYVESKQISEAYYTTKKSQKKMKNTFDITSLVKKSKNLKAVEVHITENEFIPEKGALAEIFA